MSKRWPGGIVTKTQATPTGPFQNSSAPGIWTLNQMSYWVKQALWPTAGNVDPSLFIENLFSTWLYTGNGSAQNVFNGIDLAGKGGLVWVKARSSTVDNTHYLVDTVRGVNRVIQSNNTNAQVTAYTVDLFFSNGFIISPNIGASAVTYASWTFREQPKFFDIVTYTGTGANTTIAHNLGSVPGCIIIKRLNAVADWQVYHRSLANTQYLVLNSTAAAATGATRWNSTTPTSSVFSLGTDATVNASGGTYVAYIYAHNAGGFGLSGNDNVISCGSYTASGAGTVVNLGYEAQWVMVKSSTAIGGWYILDNMRSMGQTGLLGYLQADVAGPEPTFGSTPALTATATGFIDNGVFGTDGRTIIYIAIRRGPMQVPTLGTSVFGISARTGTGANATVTGGTLPDDLAIIKNRASAQIPLWVPRLTGAGYLDSSAGTAEIAAGTTILQDNPWDLMNGVKVGTTSAITNASGNSFVNYLFTRAPGFFDVVCYTGTGVAQTIAHNLTVVPELMIVKGRSSINNWIVYSAPIGNTKGLLLNNTNAPITTINWWNNTTPTASVFTVGGADATNLAGATQVAYLFATLAGVSKVGSYTGTGSTLNIDAGFTTGARFVIIKRTDSTGNWFYWDAIRGMTAGTDPRLSMNTTDVESNANWVYTVSAGFQIVTTDASVNASGGSYIYLAIA